MQVVIQGGAAPAPAESRGRRLSSDEARTERLTRLRSKDAALDAAANALDLEIVDGE